MICYKCFSWKPPNFYTENICFSDVQNFAFTNAINESFIYTGEVNNGVPNGQGKGVYYEFTYPGTYEGSWKDGQPNGYGEVIFNSGFSYKGSWKDSTWTKNGTFQFGTFSDPIEVTHVENHIVTDDISQCILESLPFLYTGQISTRGVPTGNGTATYFKKDSRFLRKSAILWRDCTTGGGTEIQFRNGNEYKGETSFGKLEGSEGHYKISGVEYVGPYSDDKAIGKHQAIYPNGTIGYVKAETASILDGTWNFVSCNDKCE